MAGAPTARGTGRSRSGARLSTPRPSSTDPPRRAAADRPPGASGTRDRPSSRRERDRPRSRSRACAAPRCAPGEPRDARPAARGSRRPR
ncbi:MAG: hypothetical protein DMD77_16275 [Candidatus Rokuibacteriota bacterium]|nr:MAG: hypothetical protein DMD77_16275 [Candidatus Rokubacteria bacterium]